MLESEIRVLLKYEDEMTDKPDNIMIKKLFPQRNILSEIGKTVIIKKIKRYIYFFFTDGIFNKL